VRPAAAAVLLLLVGCSGQGAPDRAAPTTTAPGPVEGASLALASPPLREGAWPVEHTCDGENTAPPLEWSGVPEGTAELVLLLQDPDAPGGTFTHWVVFGIPPEDGSTAAGQTPAGGLEGTNSLGETGYGGPCPPEGQEHRYIFSLFAMAEPTGLQQAASLDQVDQAVSVRPLAGVQLAASYGR